MTNSTKLDKLDGIDNLGQTMTSSTTWAILMYLDKPHKLDKHKNFPTVRFRYRVLVMSVLTFFALKMLATNQES